METKHVFSFSQAQNNKQQEDGIEMWSYCQMDALMIEEKRRSIQQNSSWLHSAQIFVEYNSIKSHICTR